MTYVIASREIRHQAIRAALKVAFPACKFSIRGGRGTGYGWSRIRWTDGPTSGAVESVVHRFFGSEFNGMIDGYDPTHNYFTFEGMTYSAGGSGFHCDREISPAEEHRIAALLMEPCEIPERQTWQIGVARGNGGGYLDFQRCVWAATSNRENFDRARFEAHQWLAAIRANRRDAPRSVVYGKPEAAQW